MARTIQPAALVRPRLAAAWCGNPAAAAMYAALTLVGFTATAAADEVWIRGGEPASAARRVEGTIQDYTGRELLLQTTGQKVRRLPADRVERVETDWPDGYLQATELARSGDPQQAYERFAKAAAAERRPWVQRMILHEMLKLLMRLDRRKEAGDLFLVLIGSDAETPAIADMPLAWVASEAVEQATAERWLNRSEAQAVQLLAASHLFSTPDRQRAIAVLQKLSSTADPPIAAIAAAQLWRTRVPTATPRHVETWEQHLLQIPPPLRDGPYLILGQVYDRLGDPDRSVLALLRVSIEGGSDSRRRAAALLSAARILIREHHQDEARALLAEVVRQYPSSVERPAAERLLRGDP